MKRHAAGTSALTMLLATTAAAQGEPTLTTCEPRGGQRGTTVEVTLRGTNLQHALGLLWQRDGLVVQSLTAKDARTAVVRIAVPQDAALGAYPFRLHANGGLSALWLWFVGDKPEQRERGKNDTPETAEPLAFGATMNGTVAAEDVDWFAVDVPAPGPLQVEVQGIRLGRAPWDPQLAVFDAHGQRLLRADDTPFGRMDPLGSVELAAPGTVFVRLRDATFGGGSGCQYRLHVGAFARPLGTLPGGGRPGELIELRYLGAAEPATATLRLPSTEGLIDHTPRATEGNSPPTALPLRVRDLPGVVEPQSERPKVLELAVPSALHGVLAEAGEVDRYRFTANKGQRLSIDGFARQLRSPVDLVLSVRQTEGDYRAASDDAGGLLDSRVSFRAPADGSYDLLVYDVLRRGGPAHAYRVELAPAATAPAMAVSFPGRIDADHVVVGAGNRMITVLSTRNVPAGRRLLFDGLPPGVTAQAPPFHPRSTTTLAVFEAAADAAPAASLARPLLLDPDSASVADGGFDHATALLRVRNNEPYLVHRQRRLPVAVSSPLPFRVQLGAAKVPLVRGAALRLAIEVERAEGFDDAIRITTPWVPPGVVAGTTTIPAKQTKGWLTLSARGSAVTGRWQLATYGFVTVRGRILRSSSSLAALEVTEPWLTAKGKALRTEPGHDVELGFAITPTEAWQAPATAELRGLPRGAQCKAVELAPGARALAFEVTLPAETKPGRYRPKLRVTVQTEDGGVVHEFNGEELRVLAPAAPDRVPDGAPSGEQT